MNFSIESGVDILIKDRFSKNLDDKIIQENLKEVSDGSQSDVYRITQGSYKDNVLKLLKDSDRSSTNDFCLHIDATSKLAKWPVINGVPKPIITGKFDNRYATVETFMPNVIGLKDSKIKRLPKRERWEMLVSFLGLLIRFENRGVIPVDIKLNDFSFDPNSGNVGFVDFTKAFVQGSSFNLDNRESSFNIAKMGLYNFLIRDLFGEHLKGGSRIEEMVEINSFTKVLEFLQSTNPKLRKR